MSEYQCYEFVALDRPLTRKQMVELRAISTRAKITLTRFWNEYQWGDLKADPAKLMERYFDAHLYFASWGTHRLMLRIPVKRVDLKGLRAYLGRDGALSRIVGGHLILDLRIDEDLVSAAAEGSDQTSDRRALRKWALALAPRAKDEWIGRAIDDPDLAVGGELQRAFRAKATPAKGASRRTVAELLSVVERHRQRRERVEAERSAKERKAAEAARKKRLDALAKRVGQQQRLERTRSSGG